jgi:hypothetical protein
LPEDGAVRAVFYNGFPMRDSSQKRFPIDRLIFLICHHNLHLLNEDKRMASKHTKDHFQKTIALRDEKGINSFR